MSYSSAAIEEIYSLQEKLQDVVDCNDLQDVLTISDKIDTLIKVNV